MINQTNFVEQKSELEQLLHDTGHLWYVDIFVAETLNLDMRVAVDQFANLLQGWDIPHQDKQLLVNLITQYRLNYLPAGVANIGKHVKILTDIVMILADLDDFEADPRVYNIPAGTVGRIVSYTDVEDYYTVKFLNLNNEFLMTDATKGIEWEFTDEKQTLYAEPVKDEPASEDKRKKSVRRNRRTPLH